MQNPIVSQQTDSTVRDAARLYYVDWLRVIATLGAFLFHASNVFNVGDFVIKNAQTSLVVTICQAFLFPWGMPLFFLIFVVSIGLYELIIKRVVILRAMFGMKAGRLDKAQVATG